MIILSKGREMHQSHGSLVDTKIKLNDGNFVDDKEHG